MKKRAMALFLAACYFFTTFARYDFIYNDLYFYINNDNTCTVAEGGHYSGNLIIPEVAYYKGKSYTVTGIGYAAFMWSYGLKTITIPSTVTSIGPSAFYECPDLYSITIPDAVTDIGLNAFYKCSSLTSITIPKNVSEIDLGAFSSCDKLTEIIVAKGNKSYTTQEGVLFNKEKSLLVVYPAGKSETEYIIPSEVEIFESKAFEGNKYIEVVKFSESIRKIGYDCFAECSSLKYVDIKNAELGLNTFDNCNSLENIIVSQSNPYHTAQDGVLYTKDMSTLLKYPAGNSRTEYQVPYGVKEIKYRAFANSSKLKSIKLPISLITIEGNSFTNCSDLKSLTIPNSVIEIGGGAFSECKNMTSLTMSTSIYKTGALICYGCSALRSITYLSKDPYEIDVETFTSDQYENVLLNCYLYSMDQIEVTEPWCNFKNRFGRNEFFIDSIEEISSYDNESTIVYDLHGVKVGNRVDDLRKGIYIIRQGSKTIKKAI